ncbi:MAG: bifunctional demethylmenaquinone methyltransferase/2-methoxy-6-polyprenyl-1,4-benzoquinol methylase UbiE [Acidobacteriaceae bacterium]|nr:bifunctional demethylmenaquinone methyltransferase/2-methoxy-6-polyprenyl-1,4-benzoquinol methylase UbiE [Acidobacteriaceae bacterium]MBV9498265.1 bifunctional demethylmenaquinone methyltransferase/2-methoxy-6-polyprenyl-1,4-benzoquinol methylase UbiE [Acidobacteriaceae bacterium]
MTLATGTTPPGVSGEQQAARWVQQMFASIAPKYDFINHFLSFNIDRSWRQALVQQLSPVLASPAARVLDLCCGTGDVLLDLQRVAASRIMGADFCHPMLVSAQYKARQKGFEAPLLEADALQLPLARDTLDAITISFGFRNLANYAEGLKELHRVLRPGGMLLILEFSHPPARFTRAAYGVYSRVFLPLIGRIVSGSAEAYSYLPDSIRKFPRADELSEKMSNAGFIDTRFELMTGGIAALHTGIKSSDRGLIVPG